MDTRWYRAVLLRPWGIEEVNENTKKSLLVVALSIALGVVGFVIGRMAAGNIGGFLGIPTGILSAVSGLGAINRSNRRVAESVGAIREGLDAGTERIESAQEGIRESVETLRGAAKPIGAPIDPDSRGRDSSRHSNL